MPRFKTSKIAKFIATAVLLNSSYVLAEEASEQQDLQDIEVLQITSSGRLGLASEVPMNVTAMGADELRSKNITDAKALIADSVVISAPLNSARLGESVTVRGLNVSAASANNLASFERTTLAYYLDNTALPRMTYRLKDISRVETLLGPQGTLYGGGSLGGTIRYITNKPDTEELTVDVNTSIYHVQNGSLSNDTDVTLNLPLTDTLAFRANVSHLDDNGYTDRVKQAVWWDESNHKLGSPAGEVFEDDDWQDSTGARLQLKWAPTDTFDINFAYTRQKQKAHGTSGASRWDETAACESLYAGQNCNLEAQESPYQYDRYTIQRVHEEFTDRLFEMGSVEINWDLGFANLMSSTSGYKDDSAGQADYLNYGDEYYGWIPGMGFSETKESALLKTDNDYQGIEHETRLTSTIDSPLSWIAGFYYSDRQSTLKFWEVFKGLDKAMSDDWGGYNPDDYYVRPEADTGYFEDADSKYQEFAIYGELGYQVTDAWNVTLGARFFNWKDTNLRSIEDYTGYIGTVTNETVQEGTGDSIFKFNTSYNVADSQLLYFTASQGFRRGGTNSYRDMGDLKVSKEAQIYDPDTTTNYEFGYKGTSLDNDLYVQLNAFHIDWDNTQTYNAQYIEIFPLNGTNNGPAAKSQGIEAQVRYNLTDNFSVKWETATAKAEFVENKSLCIFEGGEAAEGNQCRTWYKGGELGGTPTWRHNLAFNYTQELGDGVLDANIRAKYVGEMLSDRADANADGSIDEPYKYDAYTLLNAQVSYSIDAWTASLWINNLTNEAAEVSYQDQGAPFGYTSIYAQPRTIGLNFSYNFVN
ncbi:TonB-dependent receptor [Paraferrimonas sp. SM1919]|uniref:TonB-dependent receptor n=1 Tax=Paraferrimonas sp. SM1919 TaxID=2662263 RepID=UPI0013D5564B|nr:TonB-dependent receptor [Paraferrimonas sp. SM1919]